MMDDAWIKQLFALHAGRNMGHDQRAADLNLGLGWLYYALARMYKPETAVVIGSWRGFAPMIIAKAMSENLGGGKVIFIDPSHVDDFWADPKKVREHFELFGVVDHIEHHRLTTQQFVDTRAHHKLDWRVGLLFVDGLHTAEQARFDHQAFISKLRPGAPVLFHDSQSTLRSSLYGADKAYNHSVGVYLEELRQRAYHVTDFPFGSGVALVFPPSVS